MVLEHGGVQDSVDHGAVALEQGYADDGYGYEDYGDGYDNTAMMNAGGMGSAMAGDETNKGEHVLIIITLTISNVEDICDYDLLKGDIFGKIM